MKCKNEKAQVIGADSSDFMMPDGYDKKNQYTTAYDLAIIAAKAMENELFAEIDSILLFAKIK